MAAMFTRNKYMGWYVMPGNLNDHALTTTRSSVVFAIQNWLGESGESKKVGSQPAYVSVGMACELILVSTFWKLLILNLVMALVVVCRIMNRKYAVLISYRLTYQCFYLLQRFQAKGPTQKLPLPRPHNIWETGCINRVLYNNGMIPHVLHNPGTFAHWVT